jgi:hypothetical protein
MKKYLLVLFSIFFLTSVTFSQEAARKPVKDSTDIHSKKPKAKTEVYSEPQVVEETQVQSQVQQDTVIVDQGVQFSLAGLLLGSLQNWNDLQTDKSKLGFGLSGDLLAGIIWDDMYIGIGPHLGYNFWTFSETVLGVSGSSTTSVGDFGLDLGAAWEGFYITLGGGSSEVSITATAGGESTTLDIPGSIGYTRVGFGWFDGFALGIAFVSYNDDDVPNKLNRMEFNFGWAF